MITHYIKKIYIYMWQNTRFQRGKEVLNIHKNSQTFKGRVKNVS